MKRSFFSIQIILFILFGFVSEASSQNTLFKETVLPLSTIVQEYINTQFKTDSLFQNAVVAIKAINSKGDVIGEWNSNMPLLTASTMKTITTGAGLSLLGPAYRFETKIATTGVIKNGTLHGNLHIIGGGDPTLGSKDTVAFKIDSIFCIWADAIKAAGIEKINGNIIVDDSYFKREAIPDGWTWGNIGYDYGAAPSGLSFFENMQRVKLIPGKRIGDPATISILYPSVPGFTIYNEVKTASRRSGDKSTYYAQDISLKGRYSGTIPIDRDSVISNNAFKFPHFGCGYEFAKYLNAHEIKIRGKVVDIDSLTVGTDCAVEMNCGSDTSQTLLVTTYSPELWKIVNVTNRISNNFYAETILKAIGKRVSGCGSYDSSIVAIKKVLRDSLNVALRGYKNNDGSGLSRENYVSPNFFCNYYSSIAKNGIFAKFFESLPVCGGPGTLKTVLKNAPSEIKNRIHAKSGSLSNVRCYAGYVEEGDSMRRVPEEKKLIKFAILVNNYDAYTSQVQPKIEGFMRVLAEYAQNAE
jgi:serine-type D-Ala-D-Ala carboxypeptidase/endopeptidase (penicillin-binding protein 4)